jgi:hypothetical protein
MGNTFLDLGVEQLPTGQFIAPANALQKIIDIAIQGGRRLALLGRTSSEPTGAIVFTLEDTEEASTDAANKIFGNLTSADTVREGVFLVLLDAVVASAERARENGLAMRLLGFNDERKNLVRVQFFRQPEQINAFPQDFWMNRLPNTPNLSSALMEVMARRS